MKKIINKKVRIQVLITLICAFLAIGCFITYALYEFNIIYLGNQEQSISSCAFNIDISENNPISLLATYPIDDSEVESFDPYVFTITTNSSSCQSLNYNLTMIDNCLSCSQSNGICTDNTSCNCNEGYKIDPNLIKYELKNVTTGDKQVGVNPLNISLNGSLTTTASVSYELKMWIVSSATQDDLYVKENGEFKEDSNGLIVTKNFCSKMKVTGTD